MLRWFVSMFAWLLAAVWLPAAQHCELEALGWLAGEDAEHQDCCAPVEGCQQDGCKVVENAGYVPAGLALKFALSDSGLLQAGLVTALSVGPRVAALPAAQPAQATPLVWVTTWSFDRRAAARPGAPSV